MIDMNNKKIAAELTKVGEMIKSLNEEVSMIKRTMDNIVLNQKTVLIDDNQNIKLKRINEEDSKLKPRYGDYKSEDVDINKFFYFGNKK